MQHNVKFHFDDRSKEVDGIVYRQLVGSLKYLTTTKPNLTYFVSVLSQSFAGPLESHWRAMKDVLRYLKGTIYFSLKYDYSFDVELTSYSNSDWVGNLNDKRSTIGYAFSIGYGIVSRSCKK